MNGAGRHLRSRLSKLRPCDVIYRNARRESIPTEHAHYVRRGNAPNLNDPRPLRDHLNYARLRRLFYETPPQITEQMLCE